MDILVVDDSDSTTTVLRLLLTRACYSVSCARSGKEALELLRGGLRPALILLDLFMPEMNGVEFRAAQLADPSLASIPVAIVTAYAPGADDPIFRESVESLRPLGVVQKPFEAGKLLEQIRGWVGAPPPEA